MTKWLDGRELQGYIKERQARQVRNLRQTHRIVPKLLIVRSDQDNLTIDKYIQLKKSYASDILIEVEIEILSQNDIAARIEKANADSTIQGIIIQLPLADSSQTEELCRLIAPEKDVDGLSGVGLYPSATAQAIDWLLAGYNVELVDKKITLVGNGKLVGNPLGQMWKARGLDVAILDESSDSVIDTLKQGDVIVSATGVAGLIRSESIKEGAVVVDAGVASEQGVLAGDVDDAVRAREDVTITPKIGGVGPLTVAVLFDHVIEACQRQAGLL